MVVLIVKGTVYPDEFGLVRPLTAPLDDTAAADAAGDSGDGGGSVARVACRVLNSRHHLRLMLLSTAELAAGAATDADADRAAAAAALAAETERLRARLKEPAATSPVEDPAEFEAAAARLRAAVAALHPGDCTSAEGPAAAVAALWARHEDPELDEDTRLRVYHCRAVMDPEWRATEQQDAAAAALWFCGKPMEGTLARYAGRNEKSRLTVKVAPRAGPAPGAEPRMSYDDQRALAAHLRARREEFARLEESELRDRVLRQARGRVVLGPGGGGGEGAQLRTSQLRPIHPQLEERELPAGGDDAQ